MTPLIFAAALVAATPECAARIADARPAIDHANGDWLRAMRAGDAASIAAAYADDGVFVTRDGQAAKGREAVEALFVSGSGASITGGGIVSQGLACGEAGLVYEWGQGEIRTRAADGAEALALHLHPDLAEPV